MSRYFLLLLFSSMFSYATAQRTHTYQGSVWYRYQLGLTLPKSFKVKVEAEERTFVAPKLKQHQFYIRTVAGKEFKSKWFVSVGFAYFALSTNEATNPSKLITAELRPYLEVGAKQKIGTRFSINHLYKVEARFQQRANAAYTERIDGYTKFCRFRYQIGLEYSPFKKEEKELKLKLADEVMINAGKLVGRNIFDQNRFIAAVQYNFNNSIAWELGYVFWLQQLSNGDRMYNRHIFRTTLITNFTIKKKEKNNSEKI